MPNYVRVQLMPNISSKNPKGICAKLIHPDYESLVKFASTNIKFGKKKINKNKIRLFIRKYSPLPAGTELTPDTDLVKVLQNGILISVSNGEDYLGSYTKHISSNTLQKTDKPFKSYLLESIPDKTQRPDPFQNLQVKDPKVALHPERCSQTINGLFPVLDGNILTDLQQLVKKYPLISQSYSPAGYYSFDYKDKMEYPTDNSWETKLLKECRGLIVSSVTGKVLARRFHKFFNLGEESNIDIDNKNIKDIDLSQFTVYPKIDGSLVSPIRLDSGEIIWATRKKLVHLHMELTFAQNEFIKRCLDNDLTPLFEWQEKDRLISVIQHPETKITLLAIRHNITGQYEDIETINILGKSSMDSVLPLQLDSLNEIDDWINYEGVVLVSPDGRRYKYKTQWYQDIAKANYYGGFDNFMLDYVKRTSTIVDLPKEKIWKHVLKTKINARLVLEHLNEKEAIDYGNFINNVHLSLQFITQKLNDWLQGCLLEHDNLDDVKNILVKFGWSDSIFDKFNPKIQTKSDQQISQTHVTDFLLKLIKNNIDNISIVEDILDCYWDGHQITEPILTDMKTSNATPDIKKHLVEVYLPAKISQLLRVKSVSKDDIINIPADYQPNEGKIKGLWEHLTCLNIWDLRIDLQPFTKSHPTDHLGNKEYALLLVQFGFPDNNKIPKGIFGGIFIPTDINYTVQECQEALKFSLDTNRIVRMRYKFQTNNFQIFCDLDGVLADFNSGVYKATGLLPENQPIDKMWQRVLNTNSFFESLDYMGDTLWPQIVELNKNQLPTILTGLPYSCKDNVSKQKRRFCQKYLDPDINVITCMSQHKYKYAKHNHILIDDRLDMKENWEKYGGIFIHHYNEATTIYDLKQILCQKIDQSNKLEMKLDLELTYPDYENSFQIYANKSLIPDLDLDSSPVTPVAPIDDFPNINTDDTNTMITIDFEWENKSGVDLAQICINRQIYLLDMSQTINQDRISHILQNPKIIKLGFSLQNDTKRVGNIINCIDIQEIVTHHIQNCWGTKYPSLDIVVKMILGKTIKKDKLTQCSSWQQRPLTPEQIKYSALDVAVLPDIYDKLLSINIPIVHRNLYQSDIIGKPPSFKYDLNRPIKVIYGAIFLTDTAKEELKKRYSGIHPNKYGDHVTSCYQPTQYETNQLRVGKYEKINVTGYYQDDQIEAVQVETVFGTGHITISSNHGTKAKEAKNIKETDYESINIDGINVLELMGVIGLEVSYLDDDLAGLSPQIKDKIQKFEKEAQPGDTLKFQPDELTASHRALIHQYAETHFMYSKSEGKKEARKLVLTMGHIKKMESDLHIEGVTKYKKRLLLERFRLLDPELVKYATIIYPQEKYCAIINQYPAISISENNSSVTWIDSFEKRFYEPCLVIMRGISGSGKSTLAKMICHQFNGFITSADMYFSKRGKYQFDRHKLKDAHQYCYQTCQNFMKNKMGNLIIIDNTNSTRKEYQNYIDLANYYHYDVIILEIECTSVGQAIAFGKRNEHHQNIKAVIDMYRRWQFDDRSYLVKPYLDNTHINTNTDTISSVTDIGNSPPLIKWLTDNMLITSIKTQKKTHMWMSVNGMGVKFINIPKHRYQEFLEIYCQSGLDESGEIKYVTELVPDTFRLYFDFDYLDEYPFQYISELVAIIEKVCNSKQIYVTGNIRDYQGQIKSGLHIHVYDVIVSRADVEKYRTILIQELEMSEVMPKKNWDNIIDREGYHNLRMLGSRKVKKEVDKGTLYRVLYQPNMNTSGSLSNVELLQKLSVFPDM